MRLSRTKMVVAASLWTLATGCADVTDESSDSERDFAETELEPLAQTIPIDWPGLPPVGTTTPTTPTNPRRPTRPSTSTTPTPPSQPTTPTQPTTPAPSGTGTGGLITVPDPNGVYFASVTADGSGCVPGTWNARLSPDGQAFTVTFADYKLSINSSETRERKSLNCSIQIKMNSPKGLSYAVSYFSYQGYTFLEEGVRGTLNTFYEFAGLGSNVTGTTTPRGSRSDGFTGKRDDDFLFVHELKTTDYVFSPCGTTRELNIQTSLQIVNSTPRRSGYLNLSSIDGRTSSFTLKLTTRPCSTR